MFRQDIDVKKIRDEFLSGSPCEHVIIDNFLKDDVAEFYAGCFPLEQFSSLGGVKRFESGYGGLHKLQASPNALGGGALVQFSLFNQEKFLSFLESISDIEGLMGDASFEGGGLHETLRGGKLGIHTDFRIHKRLKLIRELNVIIYLNKEWTPEWGGQLELWSRDGKTKCSSVEPIFNRCVIFRTSNDSWHGHPHPLKCPDDVTRRSLALYYYRSTDAIYLADNPKTTSYIDGENTSFEMKNRLRYWTINFALDFLPPVITRRIFGRK